MVGGRERRGGRGLNVFIVSIVAVGVVVVSVIVFGDVFAVDVIVLVERIGVEGTIAGGNGDEPASGGAAVEDDESLGEAGEGRARTNVLGSLKAREKVRRRGAEETANGRTQRAK